MTTNHDILTEVREFWTNFHFMLYTQYCLKICNKDIGSRSSAILNTECKETVQERT